MKRLRLCGCRLFRCRLFRCRLSAVVGCSSVGCRLFRCRLVWLVRPVGCSLRLWLRVLRRAPMLGVAC